MTILRYPRAAALVIVLIAVVGGSWLTSEHEKDLRARVDALSPAERQAAASTALEDSARSALPGTVSPDLRSEDREWRGRVVRHGGRPTDGGHVRILGHAPPSGSDFAVRQGAFPLPSDLQPPELPKCVYVDDSRFLEVPDSVAWDGDLLLLTLSEQVEIDFRVSDLLGRALPGVVIHGTAAGGSSAANGRGGAGARFTTDAGGTATVAVPRHGGRTPLVFSKAGYREVVLALRQAGEEPIPVALPRLFAFGYCLPEDSPDIGVGFGRHSQVKDEAADPVRSELLASGILPEPGEGWALFLKVFSERKAVASGWRTTVSFFRGAEVIDSREVEVRPIHEGIVEIVQPELAAGEGRGTVAVTFRFAGPFHGSNPERIPIKLRSADGVETFIQVGWNASLNAYTGYVEPGENVVLADPGDEAVQLGASPRLAAGVPFFAPEAPGVASEVLLHLHPNASYSAIRFVDSWGIPRLVRARVGGNPHGMVTPRALACGQRMFLHADETYSVIAIHSEGDVPRVVLRDLVPPPPEHGGVWEIALPTAELE